MAVAVVLVVVVVVGYSPLVCASAKKKQVLWRIYTSIKMENATEGAKKNWAAVVSS
jgi:hypothetical protein